MTSTRSPVAAPTPIEPPPTPLAVPRPPTADERRPRRRRRRPRAGHAARRLPRGPVPDAGAAAGSSGWWSPDPRGDHPARRPARQPLAAPQLPPLRASASTPRFGEVMERCADPTPPGRLDHAGDSSTPTRGCTSSAGPTASRRGPTTGELVGGLYGVRIGGLFAGESMFHRAHRRVEGGPRRPRRLARATRARRCSTCSGRRRTSRRSARSTSPRRVPRAARPRRRRAGGVPAVRSPHGTGERNRVPRSPTSRAPPSVRATEVPATIRPCG